MIRSNDVSEIHGPAAATVEERIEPGFIERFARAHEDGGFDRVLIGIHSTAPDGLVIGSHVLARTERLGGLVAHRPGFVCPTQLARAAITLDHLGAGRAALNIVSGGADAEMAKDGDWTDKEQRYRRTDEFLDVVRKVWTSEAPFDHEGEFYRLQGAFSDVKPTAPGSIPIFFGGASGSAVQVAAKHADVYMLWGEPLAAVKERIAGIRAAAPAGREIEFSVSFRPILGDTEGQAWDTARHYLDRILRHRSQAFIPSAPGAAPAEGSRRLLDLAAQQEIHDTCLWTPIAAATGAGGNTTALVGTPEQVAEAMLAYYDLGVTHILIRGFEPYADVVRYGRELVPLAKERALRRDLVASAAD